MISQNDFKIETVAAYTWLYIVVVFISLIN